MLKDRVTDWQVVKRSHELGTFFMALLDGEYEGLAESEPLAFALACEKVVDDEKTKV
jgi:hypothetical protein